MIWKRLRQYAGEQEEKAAAEEEEKPSVSFRERLLMVLVAYGVIVIPCILVLLGLTLLACWLTGLL